MSCRALPRVAIVAVLALLLTALTEVGGALVLASLPIGWAVGRGRSAEARRVCLALVAALVYALGVLVVVPPLAARFGRVPLPCVATADAPLAPLNPITCAAQRHYVRPHVREAAIRAAVRTARSHPGTVVRYLDAGFPFAGIPLLPHLSHGDGRRLDVAFLYRDPATGRPLDRAPSPIGYWGFVPGDGGRCRGREGALRWSVPWLQPLLPALSLDEPRTRTLIGAFGAEPAVRSVLLEPHLHPRIGEGDKLRANGCAVARHDDHFHVTL